MMTLMYLRERAPNKDFEFFFSYFNIRVEFSKYCFEGKIIWDNLFT